MDPQPFKPTGPRQGLQKRKNHGKPTRTLSIGANRNLTLSTSSRPMLATWNHLGPPRKKGKIPPADGQGTGKAYN